MGSIVPNSGGFILHKSRTNRASSTAAELIYSGLGRHTTKTGDHFVQVTRPLRGKNRHFCSILKSKQDLEAEVRCLRALF